MLVTVLNAGPFSSFTCDMYCLCVGETDDSESDGHHEEARLKATKKSRDLREKLKKMSRRKAKSNVSSEDETSEEDVYKRNKNKSKPEKKPVDEVQEGEKPTQGMACSPDELSPHEDVHKHNKGKNKREQKLTAELADSPTRTVRKKSHKNSPSPDQPPPVTSPPVTSPPSAMLMKKKPDKKEKEVAASKEVLEVECKGKSQGKEHQRKKKDHGKDERAVEEKHVDSGTSRSKVFHRRTSNGAAAVPARRGREDEDDNSFLVQKDPRVRNTGNEVPVKVTERVETPQSPIISTRSSRSSTHGNIESELSSGEDFKEMTVRSKPRIQKQPELSARGRPNSRKQERKDDGDYDTERHPLSSPSYSAPHPRTPEYPIDMAESVSHTPPHFDKVVLSEEDDDRNSRGGMDTNRKSRKLPRRYQIELGSEQGPGRREGVKHRESKDLRQERRYHAQPPSPSPPPQVFSGHPRKRFYHSPPPPEGFDRRGGRRRGRPYSPGSGPGGGFQQRRRHSRSPPYLSPPPPHRAKSPYGGSPPHRYCILRAVGWAQWL